MSGSLSPARRRVLGLTLAGAFGLSLSVVALQAPAQAAPPGCSMARGYDVDGEQNIHAYRFWACEDGEDIPLGVNIQRYVSPGVWTTVASGSGWTSYYCDGHAYNVYRTVGLEFANTCG